MKEFGAAIQPLMFSGKTRLLPASGLFDLQRFSSATGLALPLRKALRLCASMTRDNFVSPHALFDYAFLRQHAEIEERENPLISLLRSRDPRGLQPCELFDTRFYLATYPDVASRKMNSLSHFVQIGASQKRNPHVLFDTAWYLRNNSDVVALALNPLSHFIDVGGAELRNPHPLFDSRWYAEQDPPGFASGDNPLVHYLRTGHETLISPHPLFNAQFYLAEYPEVAGKNPLIDYLTSGGKSGRNPDFDSAWYVEQNTDVGVQELNPSFRPCRAPRDIMSQSSIGSFPHLKESAPLACRPSMKCGVQPPLSRMPCAPLDFPNRASRAPLSKACSRRPRLYGPIRD
jgi:hypothetical protein